MSAPSDNGDASLAAADLAQFLRVGVGEDEQDGVKYGGNGGARTAIVRWGHIRGTYRDRMARSQTCMRTPADGGAEASLLINKCGR